MINLSLANKNRPSYSKVSTGFTIVELLVVIVVIGILAAITIVSYTGISRRANIAVMQSDLTNSSNQLKIYQATNSSYPTALNPSTNCPSLPIADATLCLKTSPNNTYTYTSNGTAFNLVETNTNGMIYNVTDGTAVAVYDQWANWYSGIASTVLAGKHVYKTDLGSWYKYKTANTADTSPQVLTGLDPNYPSNMSLVSPQTNPLVDFSAYPAQNACKAIGGRLANMQELLAIYAGLATYGNNFQAYTYWSSTESSDIGTYGVYFGGGGIGGSAYADDKTNDFYVRCVSG